MKREGKSFCNTHAFQRVMERVSLHPSVVCGIIDSGRYVKIGSDSGSSREHKLFYSSKDKQCFVAIHDTRAKIIVTVLPLDYYANLSGVVHEDYIQEAKTIYHNSLVKETEKKYLKYFVYIKYDVDKIKRVASFFRRTRDDDKFLNDQDVLNEAKFAVSLSLEDPDIVGKDLVGVFCKYGPDGEEIPVIF